MRPAQPLYPRNSRRRAGGFALALLVALAAVAQSASAVARKPVLAVMKFQDESGAMPLQGGIGRVVTNMLASELAARDAFTVVERRKLAAVLEEQDLARSGRLEPAEGAKIGRLTGAQYLVMGTITAFEPDVEVTRSKGVFGPGRVERIERQAYLAIDLRVVDTTSGEVRYARTIEGRTERTSSSGRGANAESQLFENEVDAKAVRGAILEIIDYLECEMVRRDACKSEYAAKESDRRDGTRRTFKADGSQP